MKKKIFLKLPCIATIAIATFVGKKTFESRAFEGNALLLANVEALSDPEGQGQYPRYINKTDKNSYKEFKTEAKTDSTGKSFSVQYSRTCTTYYTYCKHTGTKTDICYEALNEIVTDCDSWSSSKS